MIIRKEIDVEKTLTDEQIKMLDEMNSKPVEPDEDCPELTAEQLNQLALLAEARREDRRKQVVTLRLSPQALRTAKSLGKGYTSVLSRILENVLTDAEAIKHFLWLLYYTKETAASCPLKEKLPFFLYISITLKFAVLSIINIKSYFSMYTKNNLSV